MSASHNDRENETEPTMTKAKTIYWTATVVVCAVMAFSAINFNLPNALGPMKGAFRHLGLPDYFRIELTVAKMLGVLALLIREFPRGQGVRVCRLRDRPGLRQHRAPLGRRSVPVRHRPAVLLWSAGDVVRVFREAATRARRSHATERAPNGARAYEVMRIACLRMDVG
jgi:hypothetical protein